MLERAKRVAQSLQQQYAAQSPMPVFTASVPVATSNFTISEDLQKRIEEAKMRVQAAAKLAEAQNPYLAFNLKPEPVSAAPGVQDASSAPNIPLPKPSFATIKVCKHHSL